MNKKHYFIFFSILIILILIVAVFSREKSSDMSSLEQLVDTWINSEEIIYTSDSSEIDSINNVDNWVDAEVLSNATASLKVEDSASEAEDIDTILLNLQQGHNIFDEIYTNQGNGLTFPWGSAVYEPEWDRVVVNYDEQVHYIDMGLASCSPIPETDDICLKFTRIAWYDSELKYIYLVLTRWEPMFKIIDIETMELKWLAIHLWIDIKMKIGSQFLAWRSSITVPTVYDNYITLTHRNDLLQNHNYTDGMDFLCGYYYEAPSTLYIKTATRADVDDRSMDPCDGWIWTKAVLKKIDMQNGEVQIQVDL